MTLLVGAIMTAVSSFGIPMHGVSVDTGHLAAIGGVVAGYQPAYAPESIPPPPPPPPPTPLLSDWQRVQAAAAVGDYRGAANLAAEHWGIDAYRFARVIGCESTWNPNAGSYYIGLTQQSSGYWPARAAAAGLPGASAWDPAANLWVGAMLARQSWGHYECALWN